MEGQRSEAIKYPEWKELVSCVLLYWGYGQTYTHEEVAKTMQLKPKTQRYYQNVNRAAKELIEHGKTITAVRNIGYRVVQPDDYAGHSVRIIDAGKQRIMLAHKTMQHAPVEQMSEDGKKRHMLMFDRQTVYMAMVVGGAKEIKTIEHTQLMLNRGKL